MNEHVLWYKQPARKWTEALPLGNGTLGAMVFGDPEEDVLQLNHERLWSGYPSDYRNREAYSYLEEVRGKIRNGDEIGAQRLMEEHMSGKFSESYLPMGEIRIRGLTKAPYSAFRRQLDLQKAEAEWECRDEKGNPLHMSCLISQPDKTLVCRVTGSGLHAAISMNSQLHSHTEVQDHMLHLTGRAPSHVVPHYWQSDSPVIYRDNMAEQGMEFDVLLSVEAKNGTVTEEGDSLEIQDADEIILYVNADVSAGCFDRHPALDGKDSRTGVRKMNLEARKTGAARIREKHLQEYQPLYQRNILSLAENTDAGIPTDERVAAAGNGQTDNGLAELLFHYGRYLLLSSSRKCTEPANLQGIWNKELRPYWSCNYTTNINLEMNYWPAEACALPECTEPLWNFIRELSVDGRKTAASYYGCRGWAAHHNSDLWRMARPAGDDGPVYGMGTSLFWCMAGGWLCRHLWDHYLFTGDMKFLRETARPLTAGAVDFFLDWQVPAEDGTYTTIPATSPENSYLTENGGHCSIAAGSSMDTEIILDTYSFYLRMCELCGESEETPDPEERIRIRRVKEHLTKMKLPGLDREGKILEWEKERIPCEPGHRHSSPLYGLYPADLITPDTAELYEGCAKFLDWKIRNHSSGFGWGLAWALCLYTRLLDIDAFSEGIRKFLRGSIYPDLLTLHPPLSATEHEVFQIDAGFGYTAAVAESLLQSQNGVLHLLPCLSADWESGSVKGLRARGGFLVSLVWENHRLKKAEISEGYRKDVQIRYLTVCRQYEKAPGETLILDENLNIITG